LGKDNYMGEETPNTLIIEDDQSVAEKLEAY